MTIHNTAIAVSRLAGILAAVAFITACSGGAETQVNPVTSVPDTSGFRPGQPMDPISPG